MNYKSNAFQIVLTLIFAAFSVQMATAGSLEPNAVPGPTMKPLDQVEPRIPIPASTSISDNFVISKSGSYYLLGDRLCNANRGIVVEANNVTIDLCGYSLIGYNNSGMGVYMTGRNNVEIRNGTIRNFSTGIYESSSSGANHRVIDVRVISNSTTGIQLLGSGHEVRGCLVNNNGTSSAMGSNIYGIYVSTGCTITGNTVTKNGNMTASYFYGIFTSSNCTISGNNVCGNGNSSVNGYGLYAGYGCTVIGNTVNSTGVSATGTIYGIFLGGSDLVDRNTAYNNTGTNMNHPSNCTYGVNQAP